MDLDLPPVDEASCEPSLAPVKEPKGQDYAKRNPCYEQLQRIHARIQADNLGFQVVRTAITAAVTCSYRRDDLVAAGVITASEPSWTVPFIGLSRRRLVDQFHVVALDVPPEADLARVQRLLDYGESRGWWEFEGGCVTRAWRATRDSA